MHINNEPEGEDSVLADLMTLQAEYSARLSAETIKYLRRLQGMATPATPQSVVQPDAKRLLKATADPGASAAVELEVENKQRLHTVVTASITALVADTGVTWFPLPEIDPPMLIVAPEETGSLKISIPIPTEVPPGVYRGAVVMPGFITGGVPIELTVAKPAPKTASRATAKRTKGATGGSKRTTAKASGTASQKSSSPRSRAGTSKTASGS